MWRLIVIFVVLNLFLSCSTEERIVVGVLLPLTGDAVEYGASARRGMELAATEINQRDILDEKLVVVFSDSKCDSLTAKREAENMFAAYGMRIVIGDLCADATRELVDAARRNTAVVITPAYYNGTFSITPVDVEARELSLGTPVFQELYRRVYCAEPDVFAAQSYDAVKAAAAALDDGRTTASIREFLANYTADGVSGRIEFGSVD